MKKYLNSWQSSIFVVPIIAVFFIYGIYKTLYPLLSYLNPFPMESLTVIKVLALMNSLIIPLIVSRIYKIRIHFPVAVWVACAGLAIIFDKGHYEGNPNSGLALNIFAYQLFAILSTVIWVVYSKRMTLAARKEER